MHKARRRAKIQSSMEYLMTYGWSILIIAIVLAAVFELGVFGNGNLSPTVQPNSCRVSRPYGARSTSSLSLQGVCNVLPEYAAQLSGTGYINYGNPAVLQVTNTITMSAWVNPGASQTNTNPSIFDKGGNFCANCGYGIALNAGGAGNTGPYKFYCFISSSVRYVLSTSTLPSGWSLVTCTYDGSHINQYINGILVTSTVATGSMAQLNYNFYIGSDSGSSEKITGGVANIQVYNGALDSASVSALYFEGIGGAPISLQNLTGWWPLNGDVNDYSGEGNLGVPTGLVFTSSWMNGYVTP